MKSLTNTPPIFVRRTINSTRRLGRDRQLEELTLDSKAPWTGSSVGGTHPWLQGMPLTIHNGEAVILVFWKRWSASPTSSSRIISPESNDEPKFTLQSTLAPILYESAIADSPIIPSWICCPSSSYVVSYLELLLYDNMFMPYDERRDLFLI